MWDSPWVPQQDLRQTRRTSGQQERSSLIADISEETRTWSRGWTQRFQVRTGFFVDFTCDGRRSARQATEASQGLCSLPVQYQSVWPSALSRVWTGPQGPIEHRSLSCCVSVSDTDTPAQTDAQGAHRPRDPSQDHWIDPSPEHLDLGAPGRVQRMACLITCEWESSQDLQRVLDETAVEHRLDPPRPAAANSMATRQQVSRPRPPRRDPHQAEPFHGATIAKQGRGVAAGTLGSHP